MPGNLEDVLLFKQALRFLTIRPNIKLSQINPKGKSRASKLYMLPPDLLTESKHIDMTQSIEKIPKRT